MKTMPITPSAKIVVVENDLDVYVETASNGGDNNNNGLTPSTPKLDLLNMLRNIPPINLGKITVNMGVGSHKGAYVGRLLNNTHPQVLPYGRIIIKGQTILSTLASGANTGLASAGGVDSDNLPYFDKPLGEADWLVGNLKGLAVKKIAGQGPNWSYIANNTGSRITLAYPYAAGFEIPDVTFEFEIHSPGTIIDQAHPDVYNDGVPVHILMQAVNFSGMLRMEYLSFIPSVGPNAMGLYSHEADGVIYIRNCYYDSLATNYFLMGLTVGTSSGLISYYSNCFNGVGKGTGNNNTFRGRKSGLLEFYNTAILDNRAGVKAFDIIGVPGILINRAYVEGGESLYRGIFYPTKAAFENIVTKNITGAVLTAEDLPINIVGSYMLLDGGTSGLYTPANAGNSAVLRDVTIKNMTSDGINFSGGKLDVSNVSGSGNTGYGTRLKYGGYLTAKNTFDLTGTSGDIIAGDAEIDHTEITSSEDRVTEALTLCSAGRES